LDKREIDLNEEIAEKLTPTSTVERKEIDQTVSLIQFHELVISAKGSSFLSENCPNSINPLETDLVS
jgi:hypothetical protein